MNALRRKKWTADEFFYSPFSENHELIKGELFSTDFLGAFDGILLARFNLMFSEFVRRCDLGMILVNVGFVLARNPDTVRGANLAFVSKSKLVKYGVPDSFFPTAPDLAVEVVSPGNTSEEISTKVEDYLVSGSRLVWIVYPKRKVVVVYRENKTISFLHEEDELSGEDVLPNFALPLEKVFGNLPEIKE